MSNTTTLAQQPEIFIPSVPTLTEFPQTNLSLNAFDSVRRSNTTADRQDQPNYNPGPDFADSAPNYTDHPGTGKHDFKCKVYRILVGKHFCEYKKEKKNKKQRRVDFFVNELRYHLAEFIGTFFLVFFICGIQINQDLFPGGGVANIDKGLTSGFILTGLIYSFGKVSGAHFNPCVTLAFLFRGSFGFFRAITYILVQFGGAVSGAAVLYHLFGNVGGLGTTLPGNGISGRVACEIEILMTYTLITVILTTTKKAQLLSAIAGLAVGSTFGAIELFAWNYTGASVNPWRTIGPTLISGVGWDTYWIYIVGPICGTILAVFVERIMAIGAKPRKKEKPYKEK